MQSTSRNTGLEEAQAGIKIARRNINNLSYAGDTTLIAESKEELKSLLMKVEEESEKVGLKLNTQKTNKVMASGPVTSWQIDGETMERVTDFILGGTYHVLAPSSEKAMATHSSTLAWIIPWMEEPGRLQSMGSLGAGLRDFTLYFPCIFWKLTPYETFDLQMLFSLSVGFLLLYRLFPLL